MQTSRLIVVGVIVSLVVASFAWAGGWLSPHAVTPSRVVDTLEAVNGPHEGFRRNHAKGIGVRGTFESNGRGQRLSKAVVFAPGTSPVIGRFAFAGGMPYAANAVNSVRSMALRFTLADGEDWRTGMNNTPVFPVRTGEAFRDQLLANAPDPATGKPDPERVSAFLAAHPETRNAIALIKAQAPTRGFADSTYRSLNTFVFVNAAGTKTPVRWAMVPDANRDDAGVEAAGPNPPFDALIARVHQGPLSWHLIVTIAGAGDAIADATAAWPSNREQIDVGTLTIASVESEEGSEARTLNFDPLVLPAGIDASDDPLLSARSAAYSQSLRRRLAEPAPSSAVGPEEVAR